MKRLSLILLAIGLLSTAAVDSAFAGATPVVITANTNWSAITTGSGTGGQPASTDDIIVKNGATLTVDVSNGVCATLQIGGANPSGGNGTLSFNASSQVTCGGTVTLGTGNVAQTGTVTMTSGGTLKIGGAFTFNTGATFTSGTGTIEYNASAAQTITSTTYNNLTISGGRKKTLGGNITANGNLTVSAATDTLTTNNNNIILTGNWSNGGVFQPGTGTVTMNGSSQTMSGSTFYNLAISSSDSVTLLGNHTVTNNLNFTSGKLKTGTNKVTIDSLATVTGAGLGKYVYGNMQRNFPVGAQAFRFDIGDATNYTPDSLRFASITATGGNVLTSTTAGDHPSISGSGINSAKSINRYWSFTPSGLSFTSYDATFTYVPGDSDASTSSNYTIRKFASGVWTAPPGNVLNGFRKSTGLGFTTMSDFIIGETAVGTDTITIRKLRATSPTDTSSTTRKTWGLKLKLDSNTGMTFSSANAESLVVGGLTDGTYFACEVDSGNAWKHVGRKLDATGTVISTDTCVTVTVGGSQSRTVSFWNFQRNTITIQKFKATNSTDSSTSTPQPWGLKLKTGGAAGGVIATGNVSTLKVNADSVADGTYFACEVDSGTAWGHVRYQVAGGATVASTDTCVQISVSNGQSQTVRFWNFKRNTITVQKFQASASTDSSTAIPKTWGLMLKIGARTGTVLASGSVNTLSVNTDSVGDGTYFACEVDSAGWRHVRNQVVGSASVASTDTCVQVTVNNGQSKTVRLWNARTNKITIQKFRSTSLTDTSSTVAKTWVLKLKTGSATGGAVATANLSSFTMNGDTVADGTYFACEVDSAGWVHVGYQEGAAGKVVATDTCRQVTVSNGENKTVKFWNFKRNSITISKFSGSTRTDTSFTTAKSWGLKLKTGGATGGSIRSAVASSLVVDSLADGTYFACEVDSAGWDHLASKLDNAAATFFSGSDTCITVTVTGGQTRTVKFVNTTSTVITVNATTLWSQLAPQPTSIDSVVVINSATLTVDVTNAVCAAVVAGVQGSSGAGTLTFAVSGSPTLTVGRAVTLALAASATSRTGTLTMVSGATLTAGSFVSGGGGTAVYNTNAGTIRFTGAFSTPAEFGTVANMIILSGATTLGANLAASGNVTDSSGTLDLSTFTLTGSGNTLRLAAGTTLRIGSGTSTNGFPTGFSTFSLDPTSTVSYQGGAQTVSNTPTYGHLTVSNGSTKTLGGAIVVNGNLTIGSGTTLDASASNFGITLKGSWLNNGTFTPRSGTVTMNGSSQTMSGSTFYNLTISSSDSVTLLTDETVTNNLNFVSGRLRTGTNKVIIDTAATVTGAAAGQYVSGNMQKIFSTGANKAFRFDIGGATNYTPDSLRFNNVTTGGTVLTSVTGSEHPSIATSGIDAAKSINRYWSLTGSGIVFDKYDATFTYVASDSDAGSNSSIYTMRKLSSGVWSAPPEGVTNAFRKSTGKGFSALSDFIIGEPAVGTNSITIRKFRGTSKTDTSSTTKKTWFLKLKLDSRTGFTLNSGNTDSLFTGGLVDGSYFACEVDSSGWTHIGRKLDAQGAVVTTDTCLQIAVSGSQTRTLAFWNFQQNTITIQKFKASSNTDSSTSVSASKTWTLKLKSGGAAGGVVASGVNVSTLTVNGDTVGDGTYFACEVDSSGWGHVRYQVAGGATVASTDTCIQVAVSGGQSQTVRFWNFKRNKITVQKFRATSQTDTSSTIARAWFLKIKTGAPTGGGATVGSSTTGTLTVNTDSLPDGTYSACEADSGASWKRVGNKLDAAAAFVNTDTCVTVTVSNGASRTLKFWNFHRNTITVQKFKSTSTTDTSSTTGTAWVLKLKTGSATGGSLASSTTGILTVNTDSLADGSYFACEVDSASWRHVGRKLDADGAVLSTTDTCVTVAVSDGQARTVKFWNFKQNRITINKLQSTSYTDTSSTVAKAWLLKLKTGSAAGGAIKTTTAGSLDSLGLVDGTYFACEVDSASPPWVHVGVKASQDSAARITTDTCVTVTVAGGQAKTAKFWNFKQNRIVIQKFRATSSAITDNNSTIAKSWRLKLKTGSATGTVIVQRDTTVLDTLGLVDGTYFACEADSSSAGWVRNRARLDGSQVTGAPGLDTCFQVVVNPTQGNSRTAAFYNFHKNRITIQKFLASSNSDTVSTTTKSWRLRLKSGSETGSITRELDASSLTADSLTDGTYFACEVDSVGWGHVGYKLDSTAAVLAHDSCVQVTVSDGSLRTVKFWNSMGNQIVIRKFQSTSSSDTSSVTPRIWRLRLRSGSASGDIIKEVNATKLDTVNLAIGTYFACEVDSSAGGWVRVGSKLDSAGTITNPDTCVPVALTNGEAHEVKFWNFKQNRISIQKYRATSITDTSFSIAKSWRLKLKTGSVTDTPIREVDANTLTADTLADGTYFACEVDSSGWLHTGRKVDALAAVLSNTDTCFTITVSNGQSRTVKFSNFLPNKITINKFQSTSSTDTSSVTVKPWLLKLKTGTITSAPIRTGSATLTRDSLADGTYFACEVDSASPWAHIGLKVAPDSAARLTADTCVALTVSAGKTYTVSFWNFRQNRIIVQKFKSTSSTDTSSTVAAKWRLRIKSGSATGDVVAGAEADTSTLNILGLADGTYAACEVDSGGWRHVGFKLNTQAATLSSTDTCVTVSVSSGQTHTIKYWNFKRNTITVQKFKATSSTDSSTSNPVTWVLKLKSSSATGGLVASGNVAALTVNTDSLPNGTYFACEADSTVWSHTRSKVDTAATKVFATADTCRQVVVSGGQSSTVKFWNLRNNKITIQKFQGTSSADTSSTKGKTWFLRLRSGSETAAPIRSRNDSTIAVDSLGDGTYYACEVDSANWVHAGLKASADSAARITTDTCATVTVGDGQSKTVKFWNFKLNTIVIQKFQSTSSTDTTTLTAKPWRLRLKTDVGSTLKDTTASTVTTSGLADGTYFACEVDSASPWVHVGLKVAPDSAARLTTDTCVTVAVIGGQTKTARFWNFKQNKVTIQKFRATSLTDTSSTTVKSWTLKLKTGGVGGTVIKAVNDTTLDTLGLANGSYFACEFDSLGWKHVGTKLDNAAAAIVADTCITVVVSGGQARTAKFWNFETNLASWAGTVDTVWAQAGNWRRISGSPSIPPNDSTTDVFVGDTVHTFNPRIGNATGPVTIKSLTFRGIKAVTLTLGNSTTGSLTVTDSLVMTTNTSHSIVVNNRSLKVGGNATLGSAGSPNPQTQSVSINGGTFEVGGKLTLNAGSSNNKGVVDFSTSNTGTLKLKGNWNFNGTFNKGASTVLFDGGGSDTLNLQQPIQLNNLSIGSDSTPTVTITPSGAADTTLKIFGDLTVSRGTLSLGTYTGNRNSPGGTIIVANGATLKIGSTNTFPANYTTHTLGASSTVEYNGTTQNVSGESYGNLTLSGSGTKTMSSGNTNIAGNLTVNSPATMNANNGTITFNGSGGQSITGTTFSKLVVNKPSGALTINNSETVKDTLRLQSGNIITNADTMIVDTNGVVHRPGTGHIVGNLRRRFSSGTAVSRRFDVGTSSAYTPVDVTFDTVTTSGTVTAKVTAGEHPDSTGVDKLKDVNAYWTLTKGVNLAFKKYSATFGFPASLKDSIANSSAFIVAKKDAGIWTQPTVGTRTDTSTQATGMATMSEFVVGQSVGTSAIVVRKFRDADGDTNTAGDRSKKVWNLKVGTFTAVNTDSLFQGGLPAGTYVVREADSTGWIRLNILKNTVSQSSTADSIVVTLADNDTARIDFINFHPNKITLRKFQSTSKTDTTSTTGKIWSLKLKTGSVTGSPIRSGNVTTFTADTLGDGTYYACEADSSSSGWSRLGGKVTGGILQADTCVTVVVADGQSKTASFYNFHRNTITISKFRSTSTTDTTSTIAKSWRLKLKSGSATGNLVASGDVSTLAVDSDSLADGTYYACEVDSSGWTHVGYREGTGGAAAATDTCRQVIVTNGQSKTVSFYNYHNNVFAIKKFRATSGTDTSSTLSKIWRLALKFGSRTAAPILSVDTDEGGGGVGADGTYFVCEADSNGWSHVGYRVTGAAAVLSTDTCAQFTLNDGQTKTVELYNFHRNAITVKKFLSTSSTDTASTVPKNWVLKLKSGSATGSAVRTGNVSTLSADSLGDGTYYACEADSSGWTRIAYREDAGGAVPSADSCREVVVSDGQSKTVSYYNFKVNSISIRKFKSTSSTDTSSTTGKPWVLKLKTGSAAGGAIKTTTGGTLDTTGLGDGTYYACEVDSASPPWVHVGLKASQDSAARITTDTCVTVTVAGGQAKTAKFWNFNSNKVTISKFQSSSNTDTTSAAPKSWVLKLKTGSAAGTVIRSGNVTTFTADSLADGTYYACEVDSSGWTRLGGKVTGGILQADTCVTVVVADGQSRTASFYNFHRNTITISKFRATSTTDTTSTVAKLWRLKLRSGSPTGEVKASSDASTLVVDSDSLADGTYYACEADSAGWTPVGHRLDSQGALLHNPPDTCIQVTVQNGSSHTVSFYNFHPNSISIQKFKSTSTTDTSSNTGKSWVLKLKTGSVAGGTIKTTTGGTLDTTNLADGTYYACEVDSASPWVHVGRKVEPDSGARISTDTCVTVALNGGKLSTVKFWNFNRPQITMKKFQSTSSTDTASTTAKNWNFRLKSGSPTGDVVFGGNVVSEVTVGVGADGTYYACEADSAGWVRVGYREDSGGAVAATDTCRSVVVAHGQSKTVSFYNFRLNTITIKKFRATSATDTSSTIAKTWVLKLKTGSATGNPVSITNDTQLTASGLLNGTYFACEADSSAFGWSLIGVRITYTSGGSGVVLADSCRQVTVTGGQDRVVSFYNFHRNTITIQKFLATSNTDSSTTTPKTWGLKLKSGSATGGIVASGVVTTLTVDGDSLADGTYFACEVDSVGWGHTRSQVDNSPTKAYAAGDSCIPISVVNGQSHTVKFWNGQGRSITILKFRAVSSTDSSTSNPKIWSLRLKSGSPTGTVVASGNVTNLTVGSDTLNDGTYYACEADSAGWGHVRSKLDNNPTKAFTTGDTCIPVSISTGQTRTVWFWNFHRNTITVQKFRATSFTDSSTTNPTVWSLRLKNGAAGGHGSTVAFGVMSTLKVDSDSLPDGKFSGCEADSTGWTHVRFRIDNQPTVAGVDTCVDVNVADGQSRTIQFWNFHSNSITIRKFQSTSSTDTSSTASKTWGLKLKSGSATGPVVASGNVSTLTVDADSLSDGTYFACEVDSGTSWKRVGLKVAPDSAARITTDTCVTVAVSNGKSSTVKFWNFHRNTITIQKFQVTSSIDTSTTSAKAWRLKLKSGSATGNAIATGSGSTLTVDSDSLPDGTYFACEVDSAGWSHIRSKVDSNPTKTYSAGDTCIQVAVSGGQSRTVQFWNMKTKSWTWYIAGIRVVNTAPRYIDLAIGVKANSAANVGRLGNDTLRGTMSATALYDFAEAAGRDPQLQSNMLGGNYSITVTNPPNSNNWQMNCVYTGAAGSGTQVPTTGLLVDTIRFYVKDSTGTSSINLGSMQATYEDDNWQLVNVSYDNTGGNVPVPIQLASFTASVIRDNDVEVSWRTVSEINNYGFEVERKRGEVGEWKKVAFVAGHGTTLEPQSYSHLDRGLMFGKYAYRIKQIDLDGKSKLFPEVVVNVGVGPDKFVLAQNYPNPFNPSTLIEFAVPQSTHTTLKVYNILGQEVRSLFDAFAEAGSIYTVRFDASGLANGVYFYTLRNANRAETKRMLLLK